jgi:hypothetical protein
MDNTHTFSDFLFFWDLFFFFFFFFFFNIREGRFGPDSLLSDTHFRASSPLV